jgi:hypothetical protein
MNFRYPAISVVSTRARTDIRCRPPAPLSFSLIPHHLAPHTLPHVDMLPHVTGPRTA